MGMAQGAIEAVANPLVATLHPERRAERLNLLHAWWPAGLILGGVAAFGVTRALGLDTVQISPQAARLGW
jgi:fucose permease